MTQLCFIEELIKIKAVGVFGSGAKMEKHKLTRQHLQGWLKEG